MEPIRETMQYKSKQLKTFTDLGTIPSDWESYGMIDEAEDPEHCELCDHYPIRYIYLLYNEKVDKSLRIGSECVKNYLSVKHNKPYKEYIDKLACDEFPGWVSKFFTEYKSEEYHYKSERNLAKSVYELNEEYKRYEPGLLFITIPRELGSKTRRIYKRALKNEYTIPKSIYNIFKLR